MICDNDKVHIDNIFIFKLFLFAFRKNRMEFPRNLFFKTLDRYSLEELKKIEDTRIKYIDKTIQFQILKVQKISYESMVIRDSDNEDTNKNEEINNDLLKCLLDIDCKKCLISELGRKKSKKLLFKKLNKN